MLSLVYYSLAVVISTVVAALTFMVGNPLYLCHSGSTPVIASKPSVYIANHAIAAPVRAAVVPHCRSARAPQNAEKLYSGPVIDTVRIHICQYML
jgi:hypothetical protein